MKRFSQFSFFAAILFIAASSCKKLTEEQRDLYTYAPTPASPISDASPLCGNVKGTMLAGKTYTVSCDLYVQASDTLIIQPGARVNFT